MTPDRPDETPDDDAEHGILDDSGTLDTASISILGGHIAQVSVSLPVADDGDDRDDDVVGDELPVDHIVIESPDAVAPAAEFARPAVTASIDEVATGDIILEPHPSEPEPEVEHGDVHDADVIDDDAADDGSASPSGETAPSDADHEAPGVTSDAVVAGDDPAAEDFSAQDDTAQDATAQDWAAHDSTEADATLQDSPVPDSAASDSTGPHSTVPHATGPHATGPHSTGPHSTVPHSSAQDIAAEKVVSGDAPTNGAVREDAVENAAVEDAMEDAPVEGEVVGGASTEDAADAAVRGDAAGDHTAAVTEVDDADAVSGAATELPEVVSAPAQPEEAVTRAPWTPPTAEEAAAAPAPDDDRPQRERAQTAAPAASSPAEQTAVAPTPAPATRAERAATGVIGTVPLTRREVSQADEAARLDRAHAVERVRVPAPEVTMSSKRLGELDTRESPDLLTADRLLDPKQIAKPEPEGLWQQLVYSLSRHRINLGDGRRARARKDLDRRIAAPLSGVARFVPVLSRKGGVGKTTVTALLGLALADARDDRVIAVDANPDRGTLADRVGGANGRTVRDLVRARADVSGYNDVSSIVARDATRLDVLASDADPRVSEAFSDDDYRDVAEVAARFYSIVLTDTGTGIVHSVMEATLAQADSLVVVAGLSVDEARLASETLTWLETNGYAARVRDAIVVLNNARPGTPLVRESELEAHFRTRVRAVIRMPYDPLIAAGSAITFRDLQPGTRQAARELAAAVVESLRTPVAAA